jgi:hypothetical protein
VIEVRAIRGITLRAILWDLTPNNKSTQNSTEKKKISTNSLFATTPWTEQEKDHFFRSIEEGRVQDVAQMLDEYPGLINATSRSSYYNMSDDTPLQTAVAWGYPDIVKLFLEHKDINKSKESADIEILFKAIWSRKATEIVELLLTNLKNINVNQIGLAYATPLYWAVHCGKKEVVKLLVNHPNIDLSKASNYENYKNETPQQLAVRLDRIEIRGLLEDAIKRR